MNDSIQSMADVKQLMRQFGIAIYTGDAEGDMLLIQEEVKELYQMKMLDDEQFKEVMGVLLRSKNK